LTQLRLEVVGWHPTPLPEGLCDPRSTVLEPVTLTGLVGQWQSLHSCFGSDPDLPPVSVQNRYIRNLRVFSALALWPGIRHWLSRRSELQLQADPPDCWPHVDWQGKCAALPVTFHGRGAVPMWLAVVLCVDSQPHSRYPPSSHSEPGSSSSVLLHMWGMGMVETVEPCGRGRSIGVPYGKS
jgi:hypothetical protein